MGTSPFISEALSVVPRVLGLCDRQEDASTLGCCDRGYWHYRFMDYPNARFQEAGLLVALAATTEVKGNPFFGKPKLETWARDSWRFWLSHRNKDGSAQEAYPRERSFCATAFSAAAFVETVRLLGGAEAWGAELEDAKKTFLWLSRHEATGVANQSAAALWALMGYEGLTGTEGLAEACRMELLSLAEEDGILPEYGGYDAGYQSISMAAISRALSWGKGDEALESLLAKGERLLLGSVDERGGSDPKGNSRNTQYIYPSALARINSPVLSRLAKGLKDQSLLRPSWLDDRYCIAFAVDYLFSGREV